MTELDLSVIVTTHNRADEVDAALASLATQSWTNGSWDLIIVDNASTDSTPQVLRMWRDRMPVECTIIEATEGRGPAYARNTGVKSTLAGNVAFVDDDDLVADGWVDAIGTALRSHEIVGSRFDHYHLNPTIVAENAEVQSTGLGNAYGSPAISGGGLGCRRELWERIGGTDEALRYGEDIDFSLRAAAAGATPAFCEDAVYRPRLRSGMAAAFQRGRAHGRASVDLYVRHGRANGAQPDRFGLLIRVAAGFVTRIPALGDAGRRLVYAEQLGRRLGRLQGSVAERVWYP